MSIITPVTFTNTSLPLDAFYGDQIKAVPSLVNWFQADTAFVALAGAKISQFTDLAGKTPALVQPADIKRATLAQGQFNGLPGAVFDGVANRYGYGGAWNRAGAWTVVTLSRASTDNPPGFGPVLFAFDNLSVQTGVAHVAGGINMRHGIGQIYAPLAAGAAALTILSSDTTTLRGRVNGTTLISSPTDNAVTANGPVVGASLDLDGALQFKGAISDVLIFQENIFANPALLSLIESFFVGTYGLPFEPYA